MPTSPTSSSSSSENENSLPLRLKDWIRLLTLGFFQVAALGIITGFQAIFSDLMAAGVYQDRCSSNATSFPCHDQKAATAQTLDAAPSVLNIIAFFSGVAIDRFGGYKNCIFWSLMWTLGTAVMGINPHDGWFFTAGACLNAAASMSVYLSLCMHHIRVACRFDDRKGALVFGTLTAAWDAGGCWAFVVGYVISAGRFDLMWFLYAAVVGGSMTLLVTFGFPSSAQAEEESSSFPPPIPEIEQQQHDEDNHQQHETNSNNNDVSRLLKQPTVKSPIHQHQQDNIVDYSSTCETASVSDHQTITPTSTSSSTGLNNRQFHISPKLNGVTIADPPHQTNISPQLLPTPYCDEAKHHNSNLSDQSLKSFAHHHQHYPPSSAEASAALAIPQQQTATATSSPSSSFREQLQDQWSIMKQPVYWCIVGNLCFTVTFGYFVMSNVGRWIESRGGTSEEVAHFRKVIVYMIGSSAFFGAMPGLAMERYGGHTAIPSFCFVEAALLIITCILALTTGITGQYFTFFIFASWRAAAFTLTNTGLVLIFEKDHKLGLTGSLGLSLSIGGLCSLGIGAATTKIVQDDLSSFTPLMIGYSAVGVVLLIVFAWQTKKYYRSHHHHQQNQNHQ